MEDQLVSLLANTQSSDQGPRQQAEIELKHARANPAFPTSLANIANHASIDTAIRQAALSTLRLFIERNWSPEDRDASEPLVDISDAARDQLRNTLLEIALSNEDKRLVKIAASYAIGKIASADFPERWPQLLPTVLGVIPTSTDVQLHGALRVLGDIIDESLSEDQFFTMARDIVKAVTEVALNEGRKPNLRALAISVFRSCFDLMDIVKEDHMKEVKSFAEEALKEWYPFFAQVLKTRLPEAPAELASGQPESWNHIIAMKLQVVKTLLKVKSVFPHLLLPHSTSLFTAVWEELSLLQKPHEDLYIGHEAQGRLEDSDSLPYTLDFLILEELDFLNQCFRAPPVQAELEAQLAAHPSAQETPWMVEVMKMVVGYSRISREEEELWDIDCSLYLAEETSVTANYTARTASGDLLIKLGEWYSEKAVEGLFGYTKTLFPGDGSQWRSQEASLYLFNMLMSDFQDMEKPIPDAVSEAYLGLVDFAVNQSEQPLLRARGYLVGGTLARGFATPPALLDRIIQCITSEESEVVQVACIKAVEGFVRSGRVGGDRQVPIINAIAQYMQNKDPEEMEDADELLVTLAESLRSAINIDTRIALSQDVPSVDLLFMVAKLGASNFQATMLICEAFEEIVRTLSDTTSYTALCAKILPTLTAAFNTANVTQDDPLVTVATELLTALVEHGSEPLPAEVLRPGAESVKYLLMHDHHQVFGWHDESGRSGLEVCLHIIDRLLGPSIEDNSASEVGGLAAELVEKAGQERLGPFLPQLLQASLILVFARLSLVGAHDVVEFLSQIQIHGNTGLQVVLSKWLENSVSFAGYDEIRQNVIALSKLYSLNDPRLAQTMVKGDMIINQSDGRIMTRSRAKANPDQYTVIPASLKILKVLIEELLSASGANAAANAAAVAAAAEFADEENDDDGWEDEPETLDLSLGGVKNDLMSYIEGSGARQRDDETQAYLTEFFMRAARENVANFQEWYGMLTEEERGKLNELANAAGQ
uniref:Importin beta-5 n=1 Tax=Colletotrichum fructicola (strain Nara gc5) TaxID=1213859 RepID=L2FDT3_COLFN